MIITRSFCEIYTRKILPVIRAYIACSLVKQYNTPQLKAAKILGIKQPSVNYMITGRRRVRCIELLDSVPELKKILDDYIVEVYKNGLFNPCVVCDRLNKNRSLINSILTLLRETDVTNRYCLISAPGQ
ncbi:MAG: hypothetical protein QXE81_05170 [Desulfurococcaceae archaeon]